MTGRFIPAGDLAGILDDATAPDRARAAERIVRKARGNNVDDTGAYDRSLKVTVDDRGVVAETTDIAGHLIEWGSINNDPQAPLRRAAADVGRFEPL